MGASGRRDVCGRFGECARVATVAQNTPHQTLSSCAGGGDKLHVAVTPIGVGRVPRHKGLFFFFFLCKLTSVNPMCEVNVSLDLWVNWLYNGCVRGGGHQERGTPYQDGARWLSPGEIIDPGLGFLVV